VRELDAEIIAGVATFKAPFAGRRPQRHDRHRPLIGRRTTPWRRTAPPIGHDGIVDDPLVRRVAADDEKDRPGPVVGHA
jgi:hypothetical protein